MRKILMITAMSVCFMPVSNVQAGYGFGSAFHNEAPKGFLDPAPENQLAAIAEVNFDDMSMDNAAALLSQMSPSAGAEEEAMSPEQAQEIFNDAFPLPSKRIDP